MSSPGPSPRTRSLTLSTFIVLSGEQQVELLERIGRDIRARHATVKRIALQPRISHSAHL